MSEDMPDGMPDRMPDRMSEDMPDGMSEDMTDRMPEDMRDRMPEGIPDRMSDGMNWMPWWGSLEAKYFFGLGSAEAYNQPLYLECRDLRLHNLKWSKTGHFGNVEKLGAHSAAFCLFVLMKL